VCASKAELSLRLLTQPILQCVVLVLQCVVSVLQCVVIVLQCVVSVLQCVVIVLQCVVIVLQCVVIMLQCERHAHLEESDRPLQQQPVLPCVVACCAVL